MAGAAASGAIRVAQTSDFLALPARGDKTLSVTVRVDSEGRYWIGVRELTQAARGNCNSSTANDALRDMLDSGDSEKGKALMAALGGSEERIQLPGGGKPAMACQVKRVAAVLEATATDATSPDQRKEIVDLIEKHALQHARGELSKLKERTCASLGVSTDAVCDGCRELTEALQRQCDQANSLQGEVTRLQGDVKRLQGNEARLEGDVTRARTLRDEKQRKITMLEKDNANLKAKVEELQGQLNAANRTLDGVTSVHPALKNFLSFAPDELLELPSTTGEAVPLAFAVYAPVRCSDGTAEFQHWGGVVQEESTSDEAMNALEGFMQLLCLHVTRTADPSGAAQCSNNTKMDEAARKSCAEPLHRLLGSPAPSPCIGY